MKCAWIQKQLDGNQLVPPFVIYT